MASATKPKFATVGDKFAWQTDDGEQQIPLSFKTSLYREITAADDAITQFVLVLQRLGLNEALAALDDLDIDDGISVAEQYFEAFNKARGARMGESRSSSNS